MQDEISYNANDSQPAAQPDPPQNEQPEQQPAQPGGSTGGNIAVKRSVLRVFIFAIISSGLYMFYWFYVTRKAVTAELNANDNVGLQTLGLIVPILNLFIIYWLYRDINKLCQQQNIEGFPAGWYAFGPLLAIFVSGLLVVVLIGLILMPLAVILSYVLFGIVISKLNQYWDRKTNNQATEAKVAGAEIAVVLVGVVLFVLSLITGAVGAFYGSKSTTTTPPTTQFNY